MKIGVIGASGKAGSLIVNEAVERGHEVTAIVRNAAKVKNEKAHVLEKDIFDLRTEDLKPFDVVVNAFNAPRGKEEQHIEAGRVFIDALKGAPQTRLVVVGGAGSLFVDESQSTRLFETPDFPEAFYPTASNMGANLKELQESKGIKWTYISPAAFFNPEGKRTGSYQKGKEQMILNDKGESYISFADYAIAVLDEIENPQHENQRFTVVGEKE
ncbi:NAD(P)-dependent oxidoreductase [Fictibacillus fluitans]|uniref:NAD(P)-dependent oxidoreductase n=1 Tax=Fictibacillus fluitans TaxID=3058422 RepID=A0ABT8HWN5_9BACL|nr:NAD(P)-dependent oxidoreductase [Fictibacillus sp. NE201]MDN4525156.1 NAD(P)-dependent oxidoreductase [Fictibacillus sp. NE201]